MIVNAEARTYSRGVGTPQCHDAACLKVLGFAQPKRQPENPGVSDYDERVLCMTIKIIRNETNRSTVSTKTCNLEDFSIVKLRWS